MIVSSKFAFKLGDHTWSSRKGYAHLNVLEISNVSNDGVLGISNVSNAGLLGISNDDVQSLHLSAYCIVSLHVHFDETMACSRITHGR